MTDLPGSALRRIYYSGGMSTSVTHLRQLTGVIGDRMITDTVKLRKLTRELINSFPHPSAEPMVKINGLFEIGFVFRGLFRGKSWQLLTIFCQNVAECGRKLGFFASHFIKRVKSRRSCQAVNEGSPVVKKGESKEKQRAWARTSQAGNVACLRSGAL